MPAQPPPETGIRPAEKLAESGGEPLASWRAGSRKRAIVDFVERVTTEGGPDEVPPEDRIAVFDNDGTLWCEKPMPIQLDFVLRRLVAMADEDEAVRTRQPWQAAYTKDYGWLDGVITKHYHGDDSERKVLAAGVLAAFAEISVDEFEVQAEAFLRTAGHPTLDRDYLACGYAPMIELLKYLDANGFRNYIVSGGGRDFMRPISQDLYGIPRQRVIGSGVSLVWQDDGATGVILRRPEADVLDDGPEKPVRIWNRVGKRPLLSAGNSDGDIPMLKFSEQPDRPALRLLLRHDDPDRHGDQRSHPGNVRSSEEALRYTIGCVHRIDVSARDMRRKQKIVG